MTWRVVRPILSSGLLIIVALSVMTGIQVANPSRLQSVHAAPADVNWYIGDGVTAYNNMINAVRNNVRATTLYDQTGEAGPSVQYFYINVYTGTAAQGGNPTIRVLINSNDLYLQGFYIPAQGNNPAVFYRYADANPVVPGGTTTYALQFGSNYAQIRSYAGLSGGSNVGQSMMETDFTTDTNNIAALPTNGQLTAAQNTRVALASLHFAQAIAEAVRFFYIQDGVLSNLPPNNPTVNGNPMVIVNGVKQKVYWKIDSTAAALENNWKPVSTNFIDSLDTGTTVTTDLLPGQDTPSSSTYLNTLAKYAAMLAIAAFSN